MPLYKKRCCLRLRNKETQAVEGRNEFLRGDFTYCCFSICLPIKKTIIPSAKKPISAPIAWVSVYPKGLIRPMKSAAPAQTIPISSKVFPI